MYVSLGLCRVTPPCRSATRRRTTRSTAPRTRPTRSGRPSGRCWPRTRSSPRRRPRPTAAASPAATPTSCRWGPSAGGIFSSVLIITHYLKSTTPPLTVNTKLSLSVLLKWSIFLICPETFVKYLCKISPVSLQTFQQSFVSIQLIIAFAICSI